MDPLSIAVGAINLCSVISLCTKKIAALMRDSKIVDETVRSFHDETMTLESNLRVVARTVTSTVNVTGIPNLGECLESVDRTVNHGTRIMEQVLDIVSRLDPDEAPNFIRKAMKQLKVDRHSTDFMSLRMQMLSCNTSFQTVLQAINISLSINAQSQPNAQPDISLLESMQVLHKQIDQLRQDIREQSNVSDQNALGDVEPNDISVVSSLQLAQTVAERVYSSASTVADARSTIGSEDAVELSGDKRAQIDRYLLSLNTMPANDIASSSTTVIGLDDLKVEQLIGMLDDIRGSIPGELPKARKLCLRALEVEREIAASTELVDRDKIAILLSMIDAFMGDEESLAEARSLLDDVETAELIDSPASIAVMDKLAMLCWALYHLQDFEAAEKYCLSYVNCARAMTDTRDRKAFYQSVTLMVYIKFCQFDVEAAENWTRLVPNAYFRENLLELPVRNPQQLWPHADWRILPENDRYHAAALYSTAGEVTDALAASRLIPTLDLAAAGGFIGIIAMLLSRGASIGKTAPREVHHPCEQCRPWKFSSPLQIAAFHGQVPAIVYMLKHAGSVAKADPDGLGFVYAIENNKPEVVRWLLENGDMNPAFYNQYQHRALELQAVEILELLLEKSGGDVDGVVGTAGLPLLHTACKAHNGPVISLLLDKGANIEKVDSRGYTPLYSAMEPEATQKGLDCVCLLLQKGANPDGRVQNVGRSPYYLEKNPDGYTPLQVVVQEKRTPAFVQILIDAGADPMVTFMDGSTCFHRAVQYDQRVTLKRLWCLLQTKKPFDLDAKDKKGQTTLYMAGYHMNGPLRKEAEKMLLEAGATQKSRWWGLKLSK